MAKQQPVFEDVATDSRLYLSDFQLFASAENATITFKFGEELYHVDAQQLTLSYLAHDSAPVDPLLAFNDAGGFPYIRRGELKEMPGGQQGGEPPFFRIERRKSAVGQLSLHSWRGMVKEVSAVVGRDVSTPPDTGLRSLLEYRGGVPAEYLEVAARSQQPGETFGQALVRLDFAAPRDLLFAALGGSRLFNPTCHMANAVGRVLLEAGAVTRDDLAAAIKSQVTSGKSLAAILHKNGAATGAEIAKALEQLQNWTIFLPPTDKMGEVLVKRGKISRTQLMSALFKIQGTDQKLGEYLVEEELATGQEIAEAEAWHDLKLRLRTAGKVRLGQVLLESQEINETQLRKGLRLQVQKGDPLGEVLMAEGLCPPEAVIEALLEQEMRLNELVAAAVSGLDNGMVEELPLFDVPPSALKGGHKKKPDEDAGKSGRGAKTGKLDPGAAKGKGRGTGKLSKGKTGKLDPKAAKQKAGRNGDGEAAPRTKVPWKKIVGGVAAVAIFGVLAFGTISLVNFLSKPGTPKAPKVAASGAVNASEQASPSGAAQTAFSAGSSLKDELFATGSAANDAAPPPAGAPPPAQGGAQPPAGAAPPAAAPPPAAPPGTIQQQAAQGGQITGDRTSLSHLSNDELKNIAKKNPGFVTADDVEAKGGRVGEVLTKLEKTDPALAKAVAAARKTSGADILNQELDNLENDAPGKLDVRDTGGGSGGQPSAQAAAGAAASFRSGQDSAAAAPNQAGEQSGQFSKAVAGDMAPAQVNDPRSQVRAFAGSQTAPGNAGPAAAGNAAPAARGNVAPAARGNAGLAVPGNAAQPGQLQPAEEREARLRAILDEAELRKQIQKNPRDAGAANGLGLAALAKGNPVEAEQLLRKAQASKPNDPVVSQNLAAALMAQNKNAAAVPLLKKSEVAFRTRTVAEVKQAQAFAKRKDYPAAEARLKSALRSQTLTADASFRLGTVYQKQGKAAEARVYLRKAAEGYLGAGKLHTSLGEIYSRRGNRKKAIYEYKVAAKLDPRTGRPWYLLGKEALAQKKVGQAYKYLKVALKKEPKAPWAKEVKALLAD